MSSTMDSVVSILGIDRVNMNGKTVLIEERHGSNANFILSSVIFNALKKEHGICFVLFHNTFSHYHNVGMKLGYNLTALKEKNKVTVVEPIRNIASDIEHMYTDPIGSENISLVTSKTNNNTSIVHNLFTITKEKYQEARKHSESVIIIIDDLSHLCDLGLSVRDCMVYVRYLRSLVESECTSQLCMLMHTYEGKTQSCDPDILINGLKNMAHIFIMAEPLKTGFSNDASGKMTVNWRINSIRREYHWPEKSPYLYKLMDRHVKVYAPGAETVLS